ncbi:NAD(P)H nitroreductase [Mycobacterium heckeshornense]|uniref:Putative NAD(P)H nitroreductase acg n=1 Tax=Mycobacterium heckeshornense TaxID=110505 RepID=A0A2G8AV92_9MYCO|nr:NAD(P)H nitroreductase [Mycobacterium heckeshornense]MCV7034683.1 NAD(P)H nitroreductase [Mycobacterium heckeshornense]PIJ29397.1 NAD(P)H nitroreductase [Mycobacterium heckeshornense]BCO34932.1 putative NAD(P)H nitroreductase acg [Mycobacterium heckeshornense]BCQ08097.1 putative NAD(P)H nitroreductase acg [Mycobacterium heckeshornense]
MPDTTVGTAVVKNAVWSACRAPSLHNSQPWQWVFDHRELRLYLDPTRVMDSDQSGREALISCGAALDHLNVAMTAAGWQSHVKRFPKPGNLNHLASIQFTPLDHVTDDDRRRASALWARRTDRLPFMAPTDWDLVESALRRSLSGSPVHLDVVPQDVRPQVAWGSQLAESLRQYDSRYHDELHWWTSPFEISEGIPYSSLISGAESQRVDVERGFPLTHRAERRSEVPKDQSTILVLSTETDTRADALASGEALSTVLLECTLAGLATCPVTHVTELKVTRDLIAGLLDEELRPQLLVRVGLAPATEEPPPPTPRRPLTEVFRLQN